jgi:hypothetical protein
MPIAEDITASLTPEQREIVVLGPERFAGADSMFEYDLSWDRVLGDEEHFWTPTALCHKVRALLGDS